MVLDCSSTMDRSRLILDYFILMKNLRVSKKNPSKILKIIDAPRTHRYSIHDRGTSPSFLIQELAITSGKEKQPNYVSTYREKTRSPSRSHRFFDFSSLQRNKKNRNKSLNRSEEMIKSQEKGSSKLITKQSIQMKSKHEHSPYLKNHKYRESDKLLNFSSGSMGRRDSRDSKEILKNSSRKKYSFLRVEGRQQSERQKKAEQDILQGARKMLSKGDYRKSLFMVKSLLNSKAENVQALYLSAVNWYHLEDKVKTHYFAQQVIRLNPSYSPQCYKLKAVCYFKNLQFSKSLNQLKQCHQLFPEEFQSYELEGKIYIKMRKWREAIQSYLKAYQFAGNLEMLAAVGSCFEQLQDYATALDYYQKTIRQRPFPLKFLLKKMRILIKLQKYELILKTMQGIEHTDSFQYSRQKDQIYYLVSYAHYKLKHYSDALIVIDQGLRNCQYEIFVTKFNRLLLMIKIVERDIYQAYHLIQRLEDEPELSVMRKFVEGVISLMRRNYNQGINALLSIQHDLGFKLNVSSSMSLCQSNQSVIQPVQDEFLKQLKNIYLLFLSYGYITISEFHSALRLLDLQKDIGVPSYFQLGFSYNQEMCQGIIKHCDRRFRDAQNHFIKAKAIYQNKLEPSFSLALNYLQLMLNSESEVTKLEMIQEAKGQFDCCKKIIGKVNSNTAASVYYFNSILHGYLEQWKEALTCIDQSIDRSEDHYWRYFYIRGMLLSCVHSFKEAINDLSVAINLSGNTKPQCYLLRSKCFQIEGQGNQAFKDLQQYISLKPDDPEVHKYAGQLLFQNGAFEDSLTALSHQPISLDPKNYDIFLTQAKSFFLLGKFSEAVGSMSQANSLQPNSEVQFDIKVINCLQTLTTKVPIIQQKDSESARKELQAVFGDFQAVGRIFKLSDFYLLRATCWILQQQYSNAIESFTLSLKQRMTELSVEDQDESTFLQNKKQIQNFRNQLQYNIILCNLNLNNYDQARNIVKQMSIDLDQPYYGDFIQFKKYVLGQHESFKKEEVFPSRNKLSNFIRKITVRKDSNAVDLKLCIPFPKVEPPQIFPTFDQSLIMRLSVLNVERKPEAPWILREINSIKFTDKIEVYSRLQIQDSQSQSASTYQILSVDNSHIGKQSNRSKPVARKSKRMESKPYQIS